MSVSQGFITSYFLMGLCVLKQLLLCGEAWAIVPQHCVEEHLQSGELESIEIDEINSTLQFPLNLW
ncbi:hypothetical protein [Photobacterium lutimaris]|uniref:hypothetical protein n=1 Tax=Photobacterium lutimaris TaxID=388278 RepID=UPI00105BF0EF|nr:hypothetical protein [Photobacterium lutimaris]TDR77187.1 hypothetical protein DFP78_102195 [Photobacterium lutimaris]